MTALPLAGVRVVDSIDAKGELCGRLLADLGADVVRVEPPGGATTRADSFWFAVRNANKRGVTDAHLDELLGGADVWLTSQPPPISVLQDHPHLVVTAVTDFGLTGPYSDYDATNDV